MKLNSKRVGVRMIGFTLIELIIVIAIIAVLVAIGSTLSGRLTANAEEAACTSNMRSLHIGFATYVTDNREWPQIPDTIFSGESQERSWEFWVTTLESYGIDQKTWLCPTEWKAHTAELEDDQFPEYWSSYLPTPFEAGESTPFRWSNQPWLSERGDFHGKGVKLMMPNGRIRTSPFPQF